jgi:hypothetical protein
MQAHEAQLGTLARLAVVLAMPLLTLAVGWQKMKESQHSWAAHSAYQLSMTQRALHLILGQQSSSMMHQRVMQL